jgi:small-conductance mechanosensitive channel
MHQVRTWHGLLRKKGRTDSVDAITGLVHPDLRSLATVSRFRLLRRVAFIILGILAGSSALMTFQSVRQPGVSLLASAGLAGLVIGMAARPTSSNVLAGIQLAFAEPIGGSPIILYRETVPKLDTRVR